MPFIETSNTRAIGSPRVPGTNYGVDTNPFATEPMPGNVNVPAFGKQISPNPLGPKQFDVPRPRLFGSPLWSSGGGRRGYSGRSPLLL